MKCILFILLGLSLQSHGQAISTSKFVQLPGIANLIILTGDSNASGRGLNSSATAGELSDMSRIMTQNTGTGWFDTLSTSNNGGSGTYHGVELPISEIMYGYYAEPLYLIKSGVGGSVISEWIDGGTYWNTWQSRILQGVDTLLDIYPSLRITYMWVGGSNDATVTLAPQYAGNIETMLTELRAILGSDMVFISPKILDADIYTDQINAVLDSLQTNDPYVRTCPSSGVSNSDGLHYNYSGLKSVGAMVLNNAFAIRRRGQFKDTKITP